MVPNHANVKRGSRSRGGQSAAEGGGAKRWPERDREPLFHPPAIKGPTAAARGTTSSRALATWHSKAMTENETGR